MLFFLRNTLLHSDEEFIGELPNKGNAFIFVLDNIQQEQNDEHQLSQIDQADNKIKDLANKRAKGVKRPRHAVIPCIKGGIADNPCKEIVDSVGDRSQQAGNNGNDQSK